MEARARRATVIRRLRYDASTLYRDSAELRTHSEQLRKQSERLLVLSDEIRGRRPPPLPVRG
jgi:hypothetical protein